MTPKHARTQMELCARVLTQDAADMHAEGMNLIGQAAKLEQLAKILDDSQIVEVFKRLKDEGLLGLFSDEDLVDLDLADLNSTGGDA